MQAFFPGADGAAAIAGVLSGRVSPTGRLPVQIPRDPGGVERRTCSPSLGRHNGASPRSTRRRCYPFGFGLTAGDVSYDRMAVLGDLATDGTVDVQVTVRNSGRGSVEVVQLYASFPTSPVVRPEAQLIAFARIDLPAGATLTVTFTVEAARLASTGADGRLAVDPGVVVLSTGPSAADRPQHVRTEVTGSRRVLGARAVRTPWAVTGESVVPTEVEQ